MRSSATFAMAAVMAAAVKADVEINGNWYGNAVDTIQYSNFGSSGTYNQITNMDSSSGTCSSTPFGYSGSIAPLNGEMSIHVRGPANLKQFAFYTPGSGASKKEKRTVHVNSKRHGHGHAHFHAHKEEKRSVGSEVTATIDGQVVSWVNEYDGGAAPTAAPAATTAAAAVNAVADVVGAVGGAVASAVSQIVSPSSAPSYSGDYVQSAYYNAESQTAQGVTFLNHMGGSGSGVFDYVFGNSLSYASTDGTQGASSSQILADTTLPSNQEIVIMTDKSCESSSGCGYYRDGTVAYHGFDGDDKVFLFEISMPDDGTTGFNANMPALWSLNAQIPRTLQYGQADCSCWTTGCGEFDILEVLDSGNTRCKSTLHAGISGGDSDYIERPTGAPIKVALVMSNQQMTIKVLNSDFDFSHTLTNDQVEQIASHNSGGLAAGLATSLFTLG